MGDCVVMKKFYSFSLFICGSFLLVSRPLECLAPVGVFWVEGKDSNPKKSLISLDSFLNYEGNSFFERFERLKELREGRYLLKSFVYKPFDLSVASKYGKSLNFNQKKPRPIRWFGSRLLGVLYNSDESLACSEVSVQEIKPFAEGSCSKNMHEEPVLSFFNPLHKLTKGQFGKSSSLVQSFFKIADLFYLLALSPKVESAKEIGSSSSKIKKSA